MQNRLSERLKQLIVRNERVKRDPDAIGPDTDLINDLALDSMDIVNLLADLEEEFEIRIDVEETGLSIFEAFRNLEDFVSRQIGAGLPAKSAAEGGGGEG
ncbi:acyl carrier protein [Cohnella sp. 56]|uniref:acyl carrier protein n=1 Tax=Cohnella sp. 56 TaxID=3113722 RepID=UPI0030EADB97